jgi:Fic family protein
MKEIDKTAYCYEEAIQDQLEQFALRVREMRSGGRLENEALINIRRYFKIKQIYNSNAIEGNKLNIGETRQIVQFGLTITGVSLRDQAEAKNLSQALDYLEELVNRTNPPISEIDIRQIHAFVLKSVDDDNAGRYRTVDVEISGSKYKPTPHFQIAQEMEQFGIWLRSISENKGEIGSIQAIIYAAVAHTWFVMIHPFIDGNGRVARLLLNLILMRFGYPIAIITREDRYRYYDALEQAQTSDLTPLISLLLECVNESLEEWEYSAKTQKETKEWAQSLVADLEEKERVKIFNQYELWKHSMELLKSYFKQIVDMLQDTAQIARAYFTDFGLLSLEKYIPLSMGESVKKTWFFRIDFKAGEKSIRYLFYFGFPSHELKNKNIDISIHIAREYPENSYNYQKPEFINDKHFPAFLECGYCMQNEKYYFRVNKSDIRSEKVDIMARSFIDSIIKSHF